MTVNSHPEWPLFFICKVLHTWGSKIRSNVNRTVELRETKPLVEYLIGDPGTEGLSLLLESFDPNLIPQARAEASDKASVTVSRWLQTISDLSVVFGAITHCTSLPPPRSLKLRDLKKRYMTMVHDRWEHILQLITSVILLAHPLFFDPVYIVSVCSTALHEIASVKGHEDLIRELFENPKTIKLACIILLQRDIRTGKFIFLGEILGGRCTALRLLLDCLDKGDDEAPSSFENHLTSLYSPRRDAIVSMLTERVGDLIEFSRRGTTFAMLVAAKESYPLLDLAMRVLWDPKLTRVFNDAGYFLAIGNCLNHFTRLAAQHGRDDADSWEVPWIQLTMPSRRLLGIMVQRLQVPNMKAALASFLKGGLLQAAFRVLCREGTLSGGAEPLPERFYFVHNILQELVGYLTNLRLSRVVDVTDLQGVLSAFEQTDSRASVICNKYRDMFARCQRVSERRKIPRWDALCQNLKHPCQSSTSSVNSEMKVRKCGGCHAVVYCSEECQKEDYARFHFAECSSARALQRMEDACPPLLTTSGDIDLRLDHFAWLEHLMNDGMPMVRAAIADASREKDAPHHTSDTISLFDFVNTHFVSFLAYPLHLHISNCWKSVNGLWDARVQQCIEDMKGDASSIALAECFLPHVFGESALFLLVVMHYDPGAPSGERYRVVSSVLRTGPLSVVKDMWQSPGPGQD